MSIKEYEFMCMACRFTYKSPPKHDKCPNCGKRSWVNLTHLGRKPKSQELKLIQKTKNGFVTEELILRWKNSGGTMRPTLEILKIDRKDPTTTKKTHEVKEWDGKIWQVVHREENDNIAKRRPHKKHDKYT
jgi:RNA polymerase subunit RPABC4/transcription elongation factor Spt4